VKKEDALKSLSEVLQTVLPLVPVGIIALAGLSSYLPNTMDVPYTSRQLLEDWSSYAFAGGFAYCVAPLVPCIVAAYHPKGDDHVRTHQLVYKQGGGVVRAAEEREAFEFEHGPGSWEQGVTVARNTLFAIGVLIAAAGPLALAQITSFADRSASWWALLITSAVCGILSFLLHFACLRAFLAPASIDKPWSNEQEIFALSSLVALIAMWLTCAYLAARAFFPAAWYGATEDYIYGGFLSFIVCAVIFVVIVLGCALAIPGAMAALLAPHDN
jgi:hypothetical protein